MKQVQVKTAFGTHLMVDGYGCNPVLLEDLDHIYRFLDTAPGLIAMTKIMPPYVFRYTGKVPEDWGLSGFVLIAESHISVHTFPEKQYLSLDIFSCKDFDTDKALEFSKRFFGIDHTEVKVLSRGLEFPRSVDIVADLLRQARQPLSLER